MAFGKYFLMCALVAPTLYAADVPVESRPLSNMPVALSATNANLNWDLLQKNQQLENELRTLRGKIEVLENSLDKLSSDLVNRYTDLDQRMELLKQQVDPTEETAPAEQPISLNSTTPLETSPPSQSITPVDSIPPNQSSTSNEASTSTLDNTSVVSAVNTNSIVTGNTLAIAPQNIAVSPVSVADASPTLALATSSPETPQPLITLDKPIVRAETPKRPNITDSGSTNAVVAPLSQSERAEYTKALETYKNNGAALAITPMQQFIKNYPNSVYAGNAHFWLAEFNLAADPVNYSEAKKNYGVVIRQYPQSAKAARALFQLHNISLNVDKNKLLADKFKSQLLKYYPTTEEAKLIANQK